MRDSILFHALVVAALLVIAFWSNNVWILGIALLYGPYAILYLREHPPKRRSK